MASSRFTEHRGFHVETRTSEGVRGIIVAYTFYSLTASIADRTTRIIEDEFKTEDEAHSAGSLAAKRLIDLLVDDALGRP
jgi:hypothetical protein